VCVKPTIRKGGGFSFVFNLVVNNILVSLPMNKHNNAMGQNKKHTITKEQIHTMNRKVSRDESLVDSNGWTAMHKVHKSKKAYSRKEKHKRVW